ncbi:MAG TPA: hypothetical protein VHV83_17655 [Armatimonadota bacterium]|nr:hypothetical protein [Armatimonadota bacterium]
MAEVTIQCPKCGVSGHIPQQGLGRTITCNRCGEKFIAVQADPLPTQVQVIDPQTPPQIVRQDTPIGFSKIPTDELPDGNNTYTQTDSPLASTIQKRQCAVCGAWTPVETGTDISNYTCAKCNTPLEQMWAAIDCPRCGTRNLIPNSESPSLFDCYKCNYDLGAKSNTKPRWWVIFVGILSSLTIYGAIPGIVLINRERRAARRGIVPQHTGWLITSLIFTMVLVSFVLNIIFTRTGFKNSFIESEENKTSSSTTTSAVIPKYRIVYTVPNKRFDNGDEYYVLINPVNLSNTNFKNTVKAVVRDVVRLKGKKVTIEIHDNMATLTLKYKQYGDMSLNRVRTKAEDAQVSQHEIATFSGDNPNNGIGLNELDFFPNAFTTTTRVGKFVDSVEFNP